MAFSFGKMFSGGGSSGGSMGMTAPSARQMGSTSQTGAGASGMSMDDLAASLGDIFGGGGEQQDPAIAPPEATPGLSVQQILASLGMSGGPPQMQRHAPPQGFGFGRRY